MVKTAIQQVDHQTYGEKLNKTGSKLGEELDFRLSKKIISIHSKKKAQQNAELHVGDERLELPTLWV